MARRQRRGATPIRVIFTNNYDMRHARMGWQRGMYPAHHLFGTAHLDHAFTVVDVRYSERDIEARITRLSRGRLGDLGLQLRALGSVRSRSIIYAAQARDVTALAVLRRSGVLPAPLVGVFHTVPRAGRLSRAVLAGFDRAITLSQSARADLIQAGMLPDRVSALQWGPDLDFPGFANRSAANADGPVVSTGKSGRDLPTLIEALRRTGSSARVFADTRSLAGTGTVPSTVEIMPAVARDSSAEAPLTYAHTLADLRSAAVVAIPLRDRRPYQGLTELADAIACARPVIVTRAPYFDVDVEAIGCGWWVGEGDVDGWTAAITEALSDRDRLAGMGQTGRRWAAEHWNARRFSAGVRDVLVDVMGTAVAVP